MASPGSDELREKGPICFSSALRYRSCRGRPSAARRNRCVPSTSSSTGARGRLGNPRCRARCAHQRQFTIVNSGAQLQWLHTAQPPRVRNCGFQLLSPMESVETIMAGLISDPPGHPRRNRLRTQHRAVCAERLHAGREDGARHQRSTAILPSLASEAHHDARGSRLM